MRLTHEQYNNILAMRKEKASKKSGKTASSIAASCASKYKNVKTETEHGKFDSKKEAKRYWELDVLQRSGQIRNLQKQVPFVLQEPFTAYDGEKIRAIKYVADFVYEDKDGNIVCEDAKGMRTDVYKIKRKIFLYKYKNVIFKEI